MAMTRPNVSQVAQAVAAGADSAITSLNALTSINGGQLAGMRNVIYNGQMEIAQRGTTPQSLTNTYAWGTVDRWAFKQAGTSGQSTAGRNSGWLEPHRLRNHAYMSRNVGSTSLGTLSMGQALELPETLHFTGKQVTLSFWARCGSAFSAANGYLYAKITQGHSGYESIVSIGSWATQTVLFDTPVVVVSTAPTRYQITATIENDLNQLGIEFYWTGTGTAQTFDYVQITGVQLELGAVATSFEQRPSGLELALCQRYYQKSYSQGTAPGAVTTLGNLSIQRTNSAATDGFGVRFPVTMRVAPTTVSLYSPASGAVGNIYDNSGAVDVAATVSAAGDSGFVVGWTAVAGRPYSFHYVANAEL